MIYLIDGFNPEITVYVSRNAQLKSFLSLEWKSAYGIMAGNASAMIEFACFRKGRIVKGI